MPQLRHDDLFWDVDAPPPNMASNGISGRNETKKEKEKETKIRGERLKLIVVDHVGEQEQQNA